MNNFESQNFDNLNPDDFGPPTTETLTNFHDAIDSLKQIAVKTTLEPKSVLGEGDTFSSYGISENDLCDVIHYGYDQRADKYFSYDEETYLKFNLLSGDPMKFHNWQKIVGNRYFNSIYYQDTSVDINYRQSFTHQELYISDPIVTSAYNLPEDLPMLISKKRADYEQAVQHGATVPTEGGIKLLISALKREITKRI